MDIRKIKQLIDLLAKTDVVEIEVKEGEHSLRVSRRTSGDLVGVSGYHPVGHYVAATEAAPIANSTPHPSDKHYIRSPMVGTMYAAASPEAQPFVIIGKRINVGDVLCIIEAMKMFNEIEADKAGTVVEILVGNGEPVEYDQPLFVVEE
ncbi:MAG: acetyl-CoA carboxylase, biotin carboxyl carrier protein [Legionellales bacterium RIFCSPHIGHO2_12_FULL_42_9]|nr:MAG: acetyl-CoA carboxylase, biotin carboxyl carrier protein [Legionellales bacterium RIFCSPHIGHO2_12_FULL_42_9]